MLGNIAIAFLAAISSVSSLAAQELTRSQLQFGQPRGLLYAILQERPRDGSAAALQIAQRMGLTGSQRRAPYLAWKYAEIAPILRYDENTNGGFPADKVTIFGLPFSIDREDQAVSDLTPGVEISVGAAVSPFEGSVASLSLGASYRQGLQKSFDIREFYGSADITHNFNDWRYINFSYTLSGKHVSFSRTIDRTGALLFGKVFGQREHIIDISGGVIRAYRDQNWQSRLRGNFALTRPGYVLRNQIEIGRQNVLAHFPGFSISGSASFWLSNRPTTISLHYSREGGSTFLGVPREDRVKIFGITREINQQFSVFGSIEQRDSSISAMEKRSVNLGFRIMPYSF